MQQAKRGRGRPSTAETEDLRLGAVELILRRGYAEVTMTEIAVDLGVSVRTLHRHFPAKADIIWGGIEGSLDALAGALATAPTGVSVLDAIAEALHEVMQGGEDAAGLELTRARLRVIARTPGLETTGPETYRRWREETTAFVARRLEVSPDELRPRVIGAAVQAAIDEGLRWWAVQDDAGSPTEAVVRAVRALGTAS